MVRDQQALGLVVEGDVRGIRPRQRIMGGVSRVLGRAAVFCSLGPVGAQDRDLARAGERDIEVA